ncbi:MAG: (5-formylfuran-3-yl)methyl phosphate synthase [Methylobacter sp.]|nr:(5-formylfuran-3-yl)methyl phosphate synthase [Methylobacter sp.]
MTGMLASVNSIEEAILVLNENVDIIDLKQPALGALGALETSLVKEIIAKIKGRCPVSATIGDLPMLPDVIYSAVTAMAETGVDFIKIGFFPGGDWQATLNKLATLQNQNDVATNLIAVLFADTQPVFSVIVELKKAGFKGVMLDTMNKKNGSLTQVMAKTQLAEFVRLAKAHQLLCGLAGSLQFEDIEELLPYTPDYLGFRGALCMNHKRTAHLNQQAIFKIKHALMR